MQQKLVGSGTNGRKLSDQFGRSVAISGETLVVGVPYQGYDENGANLVGSAGAAFVFTRSSNVWSLQQKLAGSGTNGRVVNDYFGTSVAISSETIAIGASSQDYDENGANSAASAGAVFVFTRSLNVWSLQQKLVGGGTNGRMASDEFGTSISLSGDSLVVGAIKQDYDENGDNAVMNAGAAYVFTRSANVWSLQQKLVGSGNNGRMDTDQFGSSVSLSGDTIVVGAYWQDSDENGDNSKTEAGAAYTFSRSSNVWSFGKKLAGNGTNGRTAGDSFGATVTLSGTTAVIGAPFHDFDENGSSPSSEAGAVWIYDLSE
ncbi:hypothetical protein [Bdellovibrio sp. HCB-110]|uniref:hypothetical protein n=1 Tax=Bdellovibrio sp. HCB-110 TaxID=3391182 RepID=UPI0039B5AFC3